MVRKILERSRILAAYSDIYNCNIVKKDVIIQEVKKLDIRNSLIIIRMLLSDLNTQYYYNKLYWYTYKDKIKNDGYDNTMLFSRQGLLYTAKWILAYGDYSKKNKSSIIEDSIQLINIQIMIVDYLDKDEIDPLRYIHKNLYVNAQRNIMNDISRAYYIFSKVSFESELYNPKEYIDINSEFLKRYGYKINQYISTMFSLYYFHIDSNRYTLINKDKFIENIKEKDIVNKIIDEISKKYYEYSKWAKESINNSWDYEEFIKYPIIQINNQLYISLDENLIINEIYESLYYKIVDIYSSKDDRNRIITFLGRPFEIYIERLAKESIKNNCYGYQFIDEFIYGENNEKSSDAYIILNDSMLIIEAKSARPVRKTFISEDNEKIEEAINKLYVKPILQANKAYENIIKTKHKEKFININNIYIICVCIENIPYIKELKEKSDLEVDSNLNAKVKGYCNLNIEEYELLCTMIFNNINITQIIDKYCNEDDPGQFKNYVNTKYLSLKMNFINEIFSQWALEMRNVLLN